ncbi:MAG: MotA/TolQ/ExbB proton channel family protein [Pirellulales bacterium]
MQAAFHKRSVFVLALAVAATIATIAPAASAQEPIPVAAEAEQQENVPTKSLLEMVAAGGLVMYPLLGCSFLLLVFVLERLVCLRRGNVIPRPFVKRFMQQLSDGQLDPEKAVMLCQENGSYVARVFSAAVRRWGRPAVEVEQAIIDAGERVTNHLRRYLRLINGLSTVSPLMGLLGTVIGMISAFNALAIASDLNRVEMLASGISEALLTTAGGLSVAIPSIVAYLYFVGRVDRHLMEIDELGQQVVELISAEALNEDRARPKRPRAA